MAEQMELPFPGQAATSPAAWPAGGAAQRAAIYEHLYAHPGLKASELARVLGGRTARVIELLRAMLADGDVAFTEEPWTGGRAVRVWRAT